eukprot:365847-Chlamydomonas_euryale.AAC.38
MFVRIVPGSSTSTLTHHRCLDGQVHAAELWPRGRDPDKELPAKVDDLKEQHRIVCLLLEAALRSPRYGAVHLMQAQ